MFKTLISPKRLLVLLALVAPLVINAQSDSSSLEGLKMSTTYNLGYQIIDTRKYSASAIILDREDFNKGNIYHPWQLIQGRVPGLSITRAGNNPNDPYEVRLRGFTTINSDEDPLIVLDGIVGASLENVDPYDIDEIVVLRDASAAAIYGMRGGNGVIIVNTFKKGSNEEIVDVNINSFVALDNFSLPNIRPYTKAEYLAIGGFDFDNETDWIEEVTQTAVSYTTNAAVAGSFGGTTFRASANWRNNEGIIEGIHNERVNSRVNISQRAINDRLRLSANVAAGFTEYSDKSDRIFRHAINYNPTAPVFSDDRLEEYGPYFQQDRFDFYNPVALRDQQHYGGTSKVFLTSFTAEFAILSNLSISASYNQSQLTDVSGEFYSRKDFEIGAFYQGVAGKRNDDRFTQVINGKLNFSDQISERIAINAMLGVEQQVRINEGFGAQVRQFLFDSNTWNNLGAGGIRSGFRTNIFSYKEKDILNSGFANVHLDFDNTYFLSLGIRSDAYSGLGTNQKTGYFPTVSGGVDFAQLLESQAFDLLKLRASFGLTGNLPPSPELAIGVFENGPLSDLDLDPTTTDDRYILPTQLRNDNNDLKWEERREFNLGLDFSVASGRITGSLDYYT